MASPQIAEFAELFNMNANVNQLKYETLYLGDRDHDKEISVATQQEFRSETSLVDDENIAADLALARYHWRLVTSLANAVSQDKREVFLNKKRQEHFNQFPRLRRFQEIIDSTEATTDELIQLLEVTPYARFNIEKFAESKNLSVRDIFSNTLKKEHISLLSSAQLKELKLTNRDFAGECFAKKRFSHGLYSDSDIFIWIRKELSPFVMLYTAGHELIHYHQIKNSMEAEKRALKDGGISVAKFLNYYGNFLGANHRSIDKIEFEMQAERVPLYGYADRVENFDTHKMVMRDLDKAIRTDDNAWKEKIEQYGSLFGYMMPNSAGTRVKALQEVLPALENAKNILFAQDLGLNIELDAARAALPTANKNQLTQYTEEVICACKSATPHWEALRVIASHQYYGVTFYRADEDKNSLTLVPTIKAISVGSSYNQTQQQ
ncbi:MAG: hypothetical protein HON90_16710 [Halobacteriovoraceae bacterium]|nr:hypothetical protein [Halobacteriovoraceae bacterium]